MAVEVNEWNWEREFCVSTGVIRQSKEMSIIINYTGLCLFHAIHDKASMDR